MIVFDKKLKPIFGCKKLKKKKKKNREDKKTLDLMKMYISNFSAQGAFLK